MAKQEKPELSDKEKDRLLMERIASGDREAFDELNQRFAPVIYATSIKVLKHVEDAQDVTNDVLLSIWKKAETFQSAKGSLVGWICATTRNRSIDRVRGFRRRAALYDRYEESLDDPSKEPGDKLRTEVYRHDARKILKEAVIHLSPEQREVIELAYFEGLTQRQISERISRPLGTVKARTRRGLMQLRGLIREKFSDEIGGLIVGLSA